MHLKQKIIRNFILIFFHKSTIFVFDVVLPD